MKTAHIMMDLETLDSAPTATIVSIGAVLMDFEKGATGAEFYRVVDPRSSQSLGCTIGADTVLWWLQQSSEAQAVFRARAEEAFDLPTTLSAFSVFVTDAAQGARPALWGNGATFDNAILRHAYGRCGLVYPAHFRDDLCFRTARCLLNMGPRETAGVRHNALDDARAQARSLVKAVGALRAAGALNEELL